MNGATIKTILLPVFRQVCNTWESDYWLSHFCPSVRPYKFKNSASTERIFENFPIWVFFENLPTKFQFNWSLKRITGALHEDQLSYLIISYTFIIRMRNISDKICRESQNKHFRFNTGFRKSVRLLSVRLASG